MQNASAPPESVALDLAAALRLAAQQYAAGALDAAGHSYRAILAAAPDNPDALHNLGAVRARQGDLNEALNLVQAAVVTRPIVSSYWTTLANFQIAAGLTLAARRTIATVRTARMEDFPFAALNEGLRRASPAGRPSAAPPTGELRRLDTLFVAGDMAGLDRHAQALLARFPDCPAAWKAQAVARVQSGDGAGALSPYARAVALAPDDHEAWNGLATANLVLRRPLIGEAQARFARTLAPKSALYAATHGRLLAALGRAQEALDAFAAAERSGAPDSEAVAVARAMARLQTGDIAAAAAELARARASFPTSAAVLTAEGGVQFTLKNYATARACYASAVVSAPRSIDAWRGLVAAALAERDAAAAVVHAREAVAACGSSPEALSLLATALVQKGELSDAAAEADRALAANPRLKEALMVRLALAERAGDRDAMQETANAVLAVDPQEVAAASIGLFAVNYDPEISPQAVFQRYRAFEARFAPRQTLPRAALPGSDRPLRVGYVSPDFGQHSTRHFLEPLLEHHDRSRVHVTAYAQTPATDATNERYRTLVDAWVETTALTDTALAERIRADDIDILVDLAGHSAGNRLLAVARRPARVHASWLGFGYTTGLSALDYILLDEGSAPQGSDDLFAEKVWRLEPCSYAYRPAADMGPPQRQPPGDPDRVYLGCLSRVIRLNHRTTRVWGRILAAERDAVLVLNNRSLLDSAVRERLQAALLDAGARPDQLRLEFTSPPWDALRGTDVGLDCFPHSSGTTLFETLYMGAPFVTLADRPSVGRLGSSILRALGRPEWIAADEDAYVEIALDLARNRDRLMTQRAALRAAMQASPIMDEEGFARRMEAAYFAMMERWCKGEA